MSEIFLATQKGLAGFRKIVVLKSILPDIRGEDEFVKMFLEEARTTAAFNHPNIAQVFDLDTDDGTLFLAMEFVQGATLVEMARACRQAKEPIPLGFTLASVRDTALALHYAHTFIDPRGRKQVVIHRDVAEKNIMVSYDGTTKLLDFGIAKALGRRSGSMTSIGMVKGTSGYMSPEQIRGEPLDPRSDIFALGVVLHECLTGMRLFHGKNAEDGMLAALREDVQPPSRLSPDVTAALDVVTLKALARDREQRYGTALEFARAIEKACPGALWHAEQSGDLVQRFYNERRQQTRDLVENAQAGSELTGELKLDKLLAAGPNRLQAVAPRLPTPATGVSAVTPPIASPRRVTAVTTASAPAAVRQRSTPGVAPRASGEKPQLSTDPVGMDIRVTRAPTQSVGLAKHREATEMNFDPNTNPGRIEEFDFEDDDDSGAKTMPATSLTPEMLAQIRSGRGRIDPPTEPAPPPSRKSGAGNSAQASMGVRHSNVVLEPVPDRSMATGSGNTGTEHIVDPFADILEEPEKGMKTAIGTPFDTHADEDDVRARTDSLQEEDDREEVEPGDEGGEAEPEADYRDEAEDRDELGPEQPTNTGVAPRSGGIGKFVVVGVVLAVGALGGTLYALKLPPFSKPAPAPNVDVRFEKIGKQPVKPVDAKPADTKPVDTKPVDTKPVDQKPPPAPEPKPEQKNVDPPPAKVVPAPKPRPEPKPPPEPKPVAKKPEPRPKPRPAPKEPVKEVVVKEAKPKPEPKSAVMGSVSLVVDPPVHVFFGGKDLGVTPLKASLPVGKQSLKLVPSEGPSKTVSVDVKESGSAMRYDLEDL